MESYLTDIGALAAKLQQLLADDVKSGAIDPIGVLVYLEMLTVPESVEQMWILVNQLKTDVPSFGKLIDEINESAAKQAEDQEEERLSSVIESNPSTT